MTIHDWIEIVAFLIIIVGWFVNSQLNRRHEMAKKRMEYRLDALQSFVPLFFEMSESRIRFDSHFHEKFAATRTKFQLYCHKNEIDAFERLIATIKSKDDSAYTNALRDLIRLVREGIRRELGLSKYDYPD